MRKRNRREGEKRRNIKEGEKSKKIKEKIEINRREGEKRKRKGREQKQGEKGKGFTGCYLGLLPGSKLFWSPATMTRLL